MGNSQALTQCQASDQQKTATINELQDHVHVCEAAAIGNNLTRNKDFMAHGLQYAASSLRQPFDVVSAFDDVNRPVLGTWYPIVANLRLVMRMGDEPQAFVAVMNDPRVFGYEHGRFAIACIGCNPTTDWTAGYFLVADYADKSVRLVQGYPINSPGAAWSLMNIPRPPDISNDMGACRFLSDCATSSSTSSFVEDIPKFMLTFDIPNQRFVVNPTINAWEPQLTNTLSDWTPRPLHDPRTVQDIINLGCWRNPAGAPIMDADISRNQGWLSSLYKAAKAGRMFVGVQNGFYFTWR